MPLQIVVAPLDQHQQVLASLQHDASLSGEIRAPASHIRPMALDERRIIGHRAMLEITQPHLLINLGIGMPEVSLALSATSCQTCKPFALCRKAMTRSLQSALASVPAYRHVDLDVLSSRQDVPLAHHGSGLGS